MNIKQIKLEAKEKVAVNFWRVVGIQFVAIIPSLILFSASIFLNAKYDTDVLDFSFKYFIPLIVISILQFLILSPIALGMYRCYYDLHKTYSVEIGTAFTYFESFKLYFVSLKYNLWMGLKIFLWTILISIIALAVILPLLYFKSIVLFIIAYIIFIVVLACILVILQYKYMAGYLLLFEDENIKAGKAIKEGIKLLKGKNKELLYFAFSFFPWYLLVIVTFGLADFFVSPYVATSFMSYVDSIKNGDIEDNSYSIDL